MKRRLLVKAIKSIGYREARDDGDHTIFEKEGGPPLQVPRHHEVNNNTARKILKTAGAEDELKR
ncbi:MAG: type II toxin-antitoxin system HicA family toxin [Clostridiales Family XIII bacterium]|nr:type II toxin-antitoxin system HicA family toxin [Clostridiales Family XIII bacterium]